MKMISVFGHALTAIAPRHPFFACGFVRDHDSGYPISQDYTGPCLVGRALFETWLDNGERNWRAI